MEDGDLNTRKAASQILRGWRQAGVDVLPRPRPQAERDHDEERSDLSSQASRTAEIHSAITPTLNAPNVRPTNEATDAMKSIRENSQPQEPTPLFPDSLQRSLADREKSLESIRKKVVGCTLCKELASCRTQTVFGVGNVRPRLCFFGEAPGADEDKQGEPFVGRAGQLLDKIIEAMTLKREEVYILNTLKCRPPGNRTPLPDEIENCRPFFTGQLEVLRPEFIVCLGACAAQSLLRTKESIGKLRGRAHDYRGIRVYATYHPAYLLRNPPAKRDVWEDMKIVMKEMGLKIPKS